MTRQRGFTLIEMMVVLTIIAILSALVISVQPRTYGASAESVANQIVSFANIGKMRAVSTRHYQRLEITPTSATLWQWSELGMTVPAGSCTTSPVSHCWQLVQTMSFGSKSTVWDTSTTVYATAGASVSQNGTLDSYFDFKPDGSSTGGTIFVTDMNGAKRWRVLIYRVTGSSYTRETW
jgi:prepilin-type N-terminal cleavage/methylation domain-containing protein